MSTRKTAAESPNYLKQKETAIDRKRTNSLVVAFCLLSVVAWESVAYGGLLNAPRGGRPTVSRPTWMNWRARQSGLLKGDNLAHPGAVDEIMVLGRQTDTAKFLGKDGHNVLSTNIWDIHVNDGWIMRGIMEGRTFLLASKPSIATLRQAPKVVSFR